MSQSQNQNQNQNQNVNDMLRQQMPQPQQNVQLTNSNAPIVTGMQMQQNTRQLPLQQPSQQMQQPALQTLQPSLQQSAQQDYTVMGVSPFVQNTNTIPQPPAPPAPPIALNALNQPTAQLSGQQEQQGVPSGQNHLQTTRQDGTTDQGDSSYQSIIDQQQAQINALMAQNAALNGQITQMVQNGAQFSQQVQQPMQQAQQVQQPMQVFNPPSLASDEDWSVAALAKDIGTKQHRHSKQ